MGRTDYSICRTNTETDVPAEPSLTLSLCVFPAGSVAVCVIGCDVSAYLPCMRVSVCLCAPVCAIVHLSVLL